MQREMEVNMRKLFKSISIVIAILLIIMLIPVQVQTDAAAMPKLSKSKLTITAGKNNQRLKCGQSEHKLPLPR